MAPFAESYKIVIRVVCWVTIDMMHMKVVGAFAPVTLIPVTHKNTVPNLLPLCKGIFVSRSDHQVKFSAENIGGFFIRKGTEEAVHLISIAVRIIIAG